MVTAVTNQQDVVLMISWTCNRFFLNIWRKNGVVKLFKWVFLEKTSPHLMFWWKNWENIIISVLIETRPRATGSKYKYRHHSESPIVIAICIGLAAKKTVCMPQANYVEICYTAINRLTDNVTLITEWAGRCNLSTESLNLWRVCIENGHIMTIWIMTILS